MGLARVELGAMVAGFTGQREPFAVVPPTRIELAAYGELLLDGARTHYWSLANDPVAGMYWSYRARPVTGGDRERGRPEIDETQAIAYGRRAALAREFVRAVQLLGKGRFTPQQGTELTSWDQELGELVETVAYKVLGLGESASVATSTTTQARAINAGDRLQGWRCPFLRCDTNGRVVTPASGAGGAGTRPKASGGVIPAKKN
jgi:hypothetical protein